MADVTPLYTYWNLQEQSVAGSACQHMSCLTWQSCQLTACAHMSGCCGQQLLKKSRVLHPEKAQLLTKRKGRL